MKLLVKNSEAWKKARENGKSITLTFYACNTASEEYETRSGNVIKRDVTFAEKVSKLSGLTVNAPDGYVLYGKHKNGSTSIVGIANMRNNGGFLTFRDGKQIEGKMDLRTALMLSQISATLKR